jgi:hypothetical protein
MLDKYQNNINSIDRQEISNQLENAERINLNIMSRNKLEFPN